LTRALVPKRATIAGVASLAVLSLACSPEASETGFVESSGLILGQVWEGPEQKLYSQGNEELIVRDFFSDEKQGIFLDVGSGQPIAGSTTYYLENHLEWSGIAIDAQSEYAPGYAKVRPDTRFFSYIVTDHSGKKEKFYRVLGAQALSSTNADP
jgi:hypothetical protein